MKYKNISTSLICLLPSIFIIPVLINFVYNFNIGGLNLLSSFLNAAIKPDISDIVLESTIKGLRTTFSIAFISWIISIIIGLILGLLSSKLYLSNYNSNNLITSNIIRFFLIPRAIHEMIWALVLQSVFGLSPLIAILAITIPYSFNFAKIISGQIDNLDIKPLISLKSNGANNLLAILTFTIPKMTSTIISHAAYRFECALRGATLLGVFGLGGIGTELELTLRSLKFNELWTSIWALWLMMFIVENLVNFIQRNLKNYQLKPINIMTVTFVASIIFITSLNTISQTHLDLTIGIDNFDSLRIDIGSIIDGYNSLPILRLTTITLIITFFTSIISLSMPPLMLLTFQNKNINRVFSTIWSLMRIVPTPLSALLLLLCSHANLAIAIISLSIHNIGIMGRALKEGIDNQQSSLFDSFISCGISERKSWLYGKLSLEANKYLAYASYRTEVIMKETSVLGVIGGSGLGWQLRESLSSFAWGEVFMVIITYIIIFMLWEKISNKVQNIFIGLKSPEKSPYSMST